MNSTFNTSSEENFNTALKMSAQEYDYNSLIGFLSSDIIEKQIAVLKLTEIKSKEEKLTVIKNDLKPAADIETDLDFTPKRFIAKTPRRSGL